MKKLFIFLFTMSFMVNCTTSMPQEVMPSWVGYTYDSVVTQRDYIAAVGNGTTKEAAEKSAQLTLSQVFNTSVKSVEKQFTTDDSSGSNSNYLSNEEYVSQVENLQGIEVHDVYPSGDGTYWVRIVWNKQQAIDRMNSLLLTPRTQIESFEKRSEEASNPFEKFRYLSKALQIAEEMQSSIDTLSVLKGTVQSSPVAQLKSQISVVQKDLVVRMNVDNVTPELRNKVKAEVSHTLESHGFTIDDNAPSLLAIGYSQTMEEKDQLFYCHNDFSYEVRSEGKVLSTFTNFSRGVGINALTASAKALQKSCEALDKEFL